MALTKHGIALPNFLVQEHLCERKNVLAFICMNTLKHEFSAFVRTAQNAAPTFDIASQRSEGEKKVQQYWSHKNVCRPQEIL